MAYLRQPSSDGSGESYIRVLLDGLENNTYEEILIINNTTGQSYYASVAGGTTGNYRSTTQTFSGLTCGTSYEFYAYATPVGSTPKRIPTTEGTYYSFSTSACPPPPDQPPSISINGHDGSNKVEVTWSASDDKGLRSNNTFATYISGPDNTTLGFKEYTNNYSYTFATDGTGAAFQVGKVYLVQIGVYDNAGQSSIAQRYVTFTKTRPANFAWTIVKNKTDPPVLLTTEWNDLLDKINEFRAYKGLSQITTFIRASSNEVFTAEQFNQAVNIINTLSPPVLPPVTVAKDSVMSSSQLNGLRDSLNSVPTVT
jgi:hypothetical protein